MSTRRNFLALLGFAPAAVATGVNATTELTMQDAVSKFEEGRVVKEGLAGAWCQTGNQYIAITHGGHKEEGKEVLGYTSTKEEAIKGWLQAALLYARNRPGTIYWRTRPEIDLRIHKDGKEDWMVYSRLVITDNPEVGITMVEPVEPRKAEPIPEDFDYNEGIG